MILTGTLISETPIYRGNARKTLFTRDGSGTQRLVSLAGEIHGTAESLMDAFIGTSRNGKNMGLLNRLWERLYGEALPQGMITRVECLLQERSYPRDRLFDLRMGIRLDEDRWAAEANANYKMETLYRHSAFDFTMNVDDRTLAWGDNAARLDHALRELREGRFWFGAGKSKGLGRCRLELDTAFSAPDAPPRINTKANHVTISLTFDATHPVLVGWNWGKIDPEVPAFAAVEGRILVEALRDLPGPLRDRLGMALAGPILSPEDYKQKLADYLPRAIVGWLSEAASQTQEVWMLPSAALAKLGKGKYAIAKKAMGKIQPLTDRPFDSREAVETAFVEALGKDAKKYRRVLDVLEQTTTAQKQFDHAAWAEVAGALGLDAGAIADLIEDEAALTQALSTICQSALPRLYQHIDQHLKLLQSDAWVDAEIALREDHLRIKTLLLEGKIGERQWSDRSNPPEGVGANAWREFLDAHNRVQHRHMVHPRNLNKSIANDRNFIDFITAYRSRTRQEFSQPANTDFRAGGPSGREVARKYGKPYDTIFMRMLSWAPSSGEKEGWEIYIPGSTLKGAFRKRAAQILRTLSGDSRSVAQLLNHLFGAQRRRGIAFFSDAYLTDPNAPEQAWCSMDGVRMDAATGAPVEEAKADYLFAYGGDLVFNLRIDLQDVTQSDMEALSLLSHLLQDFQRGDIPLGGEKTVGFGWVAARVDRLTCLATDPQGALKAFFASGKPTQDGIWQRLSLEGDAAAKALAPSAPLSGKTPPASPLRTPQGFVSHRAFGGLCGTLEVAVEVLTPVAVRESGEPSWTANLNGQLINGWDFFSLSSPEAAKRSNRRIYALPSKSLKGVIRHLYAIASNAREASPDIARLNPVDSLFGWVGKGSNQALMGRLSFGFGLFENSEPAWFKTPYPYGNWHYQNGQWQHRSGSRTDVVRVGQRWRLFPHAPPAACVVQSEAFAPDTAQAAYFRAMLPGSKCRFAIRFWNLEEEELQRLVWCIGLEDGLAHKMGGNRYLGFGSLSMRVLPDSYFIDWTQRYACKSEADWRKPLSAETWRRPEVIQFYPELRKALDAHNL